MAIWFLISGYQMAKVNIHTCKDCPMRKLHRGYGENWDYADVCAAPGGKGRHLFDAEFEPPYTFPGWCPLPVTITRNAK